MTLTGDREIGVVSGRVGMYAFKILLFLRQIFLAIALFTMSSFFKDTIVLINISVSTQQEDQFFYSKSKTWGPYFYIANGIS